MWDKDVDCYSANTSLSSLDDVFNVIPQTGDARLSPCHSIPSYSSTASNCGDPRSGTQTPLSSVCDEILINIDTSSRKQLLANHNNFVVTTDDGEIHQANHAASSDTRDEYAKAQRLQSIAVTSMRIIKEHNRRVNTPAVIAFEQTLISPEGYHRMALLPDPDDFVSIDHIGNGNVLEPDYSTISMTHSEY